MATVLPIPENERARLERLRRYGVLDTPPGEAFDRVTRLASRLLKMPVALVSLIDQDRQWFKSRVGLDATETPRELAFCAHAICDSAVMVVPNAQNDPRFADNPLVTGAPHIRFYAGAPLRTGDGLNLGTLCVIDQSPREFTEDERALLTDLAHIVIDELELQALVASEQQSRSRLIDAIEAAPDGFVFFDSEDRLALCNERYREFYPESADLMTEGTRFEDIVRAGVAHGQFPAAEGREEDWIAERLAMHRDPQEPIEQQAKDGRWVRIQERRTRDGGTVGFRTDITALKEREIELERLAQREQEARNRLIDAIETAPDGFVYYDRDDRLALCNERYREFYRESADLMVPGASFEQLLREGVARGQFPAAKGNEEAWIETRLETHRNPGRPIEQQLPSGRWVRIEERRTRDGGTVGFRTDITALKEREIELERLAQREQEARNRLIDAIEAAPDGFVYFDSDDRLELCNERYRALYPESADLLVPGTPFETIIREGVARGQYPKADGNEEAWIRERMRMHRAPKGFVEQQLADGRWMRIEERRIRDGGTVGFRIDITELKEREFELERLATTDSLTGAMNRRRFLEAGAKELRRGMRYDVPVSVALFDVDHFKTVNDTYGHAAGDDVLCHLVKVAKETLREHDLLCRYGGEEFAVVFPESDSAAAEVAAMRLRQAIEGSEISTEQGSVQITISVGGTQLDPHNDSLESALSRADSALYEAKEGGRNRVVFKNPTTPVLKAAL